jgi:hypothetical protein
MGRKRGLRLTSNLNHTQWSLKGITNLYERVVGVRNFASTHFEDWLKMEVWLKLLTENR